MEDRRNLVAAIILLVLIVLVVGGTVFFLSRALGFKVNLPFFGGTAQPVATTSTSPVPTFVSTTSPQPSIIPGSDFGGVVTPTDNPNFNNYNGQGFKLTYPSNWGLLTCTTSQNFEFDPYNSTRVTIPCERAIKPITVLVNSNQTCSGENVTITQHQVNRSKTQYRDWLTYQWCLGGGGVNLNITHRVASSGITGTSKDDFSSQVEQMISTLVIQ